MNDTNQDSTPESVVTPAAKPVVKSPSRRRLIKLGTAGVPVVATLASSPAMAWHCRTASAWGSNMDDTKLTASQKTNPAHDGTADECWAINDWCNNLERSATGTKGKPWDALHTNICGSKLLPTKDSKGKTIATADRYKYVTVDMLVNACGGRVVKPANCNGASMVVTVLANAGDDFSRCLLVAQLNYLFPTNANKIQWCAKNAKGENQLPKMATGSYQPNGIGTPWDKTKIVKYLRNNYMSI